jgi:hypothetical protein
MVGTIHPMARLVKYIITVSTVSRSFFAAETVETVETVKEFFPNPTTRLKPGVNETSASGSEVYATSFSETISIR